MAYFLCKITCCMIYCVNTVGWSVSEEIAAKLNGLFSGQYFSSGIDRQAGKGVYFFSNSAPAIDF